ncbi:shugoshinhypothetical protein [Limosa lapponica baueri]|uniref:Uncharacterized protein n=1 Tax=Limosa lapponica baueri TaxID=1758121 RepID=A0A2I0UH96_LIMLA|nr:shugoshinhypothetical protein [Limosa lapponica baueri]
MSSTCNHNFEVFEEALPLWWTLLEASRSPTFDLRGIILLDSSDALLLLSATLRGVSQSKAGFRTFAIQKVGNGQALVEAVPEESGQLEGANKREKQEIGGAGESLRALVCKCRRHEGVPQHIVKLGEIPESKMKATTDDSKPDGFVSEDHCESASLYAIKEVEKECGESTVLVDEECGEGYNLWACQNGEHNQSLMLKRRMSGMGNTKKTKLFVAGEPCWAEALRQP